jgi:DNA invertase Pin-like site-specific DNA recombinase
MDGLLAIFAAFEREILRERTEGGLAHARKNGKRLGRAATAAIHAAEARELHRAGVSKSEIAQRFHIGRTSVHRILGSGWIGAKMVVECCCNPIRCFGGQSRTRS